MKMDRSIVTIFLLVVALHAGIIIWAVALSTSQKLIVSTPPLLVKTISLQSPKPITPPPSTPAVSPPKKNVAEAAVDKPKKNVPSAVQKKAPPTREVKKEDPLLDEARQALKRLQQPVTLNPTKLHVPDEAVAPSTSLATYDQTLGQRLQALVRLPEYGKVAIQLTLHRNGTVAKVVITAAESDNNREYIQKLLPNLRFPTFGKQYSGEESHTFTLVLENE